MKVLQNKIDDLNLELTVELEAADYAEIVRKKLADCRRKADFKGFRKGNVPASMIKKVYGEQCLAEAVNQLIAKALDEHITENKLRVLGEPLGSEKQPELEWEDGKDFTFVFDLGLSPEVNFEVEKSDTVPSYSVTIAAKDKATMAENLKKFYEEKKEEKTDEDIDKEVTERLKTQFKNEAEWRLSKDIRDYFVEKAAIALPEEFLKRWLVYANNGKVTAEDVEKDFAGFAADFKWQLVRGYLMKKYDFKIEENDIREAAEAFVTYQYAMYGLSNVPAEMISEAVVNVLQDQRQIERLAEQVEDQKVLAELKEEITLKSTKITSAKFRELN
ncbi:MAG: trigger factor family protein [Bacteroidales bacterium]|nr:trigger factor family protein [Bacteroidales bacterium]